MGKNYFILLTSIFLITASVNSYGESGSDADRCYSGNDPKFCISALVTAGTNNELKQQLSARSCKLGSLYGCHVLVNALAEKSDIDGAIEVALNNCEKGYFFSCESAGYFLEKKGRLEDARRNYLKSCSLDKDTLRGCESLGQLSAGHDANELLAGSCAKQQVWACFAYGFAEKQAERLESAKKIFMAGCESSPALKDRFCEEAFKFISLPADVQHVFNGEEICTHWRGEPAYDAERAKQIERGIEESCKDRSVKRASLKKKYQGDRDILFVLDNLNSTGSGSSD